MAEVSSSKRQRRALIPHDHTVQYYLENSLGTCKTFEYIHLIEEFLRF